jgi:hypothetical protein
MQQACNCYATAMQLTPCTQDQELCGQPGDHPDAPPHVPLHRRQPELLLLLLLLYVHPARTGMSDCRWQGAFVGDDQAEALAALG